MRVLRVLQDIIKRENPTVADCFIVETLLASADIVSTVNHRTLSVYGGLNTKYDVIDFLRDYQLQIKKDMKNKE